RRRNDAARGTAAVSEQPLDARTAEPRVAGAGQARRAGSHGESRFHFQKAPCKGAGSARLKLDFRVANSQNHSTKAAGEVLTAKQAPHRPGISPAQGLRADGDDTLSLYRRPPAKTPSSRGRVLHDYPRFQHLVASVAYVNPPCDFTRRNFSHAPRADGSAD